MTLLVISNVCERSYVCSLGKRILDTPYLRMTYILARDFSLHYVPFRMTSDSKGLQYLSFRVEVCQPRERNLVGVAAFMRICMRRL